jgi:hypothetical protein
MQQGKQRMIDLFMNTFVTHQLMDIIPTACGAINCAPSNSLFHPVQSPGRLKYIDGEGQKQYEGETLHPKNSLDAP